MSTANIDTGARVDRPTSDSATIPLLQEIRARGRVWNDLAQQYGVSHPDPPWKITLEATCDLLAEDACALPALERRNEEDDLAETIYADVPFPERQLLALAHSMIRRGLLDEAELASRMKEVGDRLNTV